MIQMQGPVAAAGQLDGLRLPPAAAQGTVRSWHAVLRNQTKRREGLAAMLKKNHIKTSTLFWSD